MVESVHNIELFHVAQTIAYNPHALPAVGSTIDVGAGHNPLFGFYEAPRTFELRRHDGSTHQLSAIHWLEQVEAGFIAPDNLPLAARMVAKHFQMLSRELAMELVRREVAPAAPSRMSCLWASETLDQAIRWRTILNSPCTILALTATGTILRADASLLNADAEPYSMMVSKAERYWRGEHGETPLPEILFEGSATVTSHVAE